MKKWIIAGVAAIAVIAIVCGVLLASGGGTEAKPVLITATARTRDLREEVSVPGVLERAQQRTVNAVASAGSGTAATGSAVVSSVTLKDGAPLASGQTILAVDGRSSVAVDGTLPFFRRLDVGAQGADVKQLKSVLLGAGFSPGPIDQSFTEQTRFALAQWQAQRGYPGASPSPGQAVNVALQQGSGYQLGAQTSAGLTIGPPAVKSAARRPAPRGDVGITAVPTMTISATTSVVAQGSTARFVVIASVAPSSALSLNFSVAGIDPADLIRGASPVTFPAGVLQLTIPIFIRPNAMAPDQTLTVSLQSGSGYNLGSPSSSSVSVPTTATPKLTVSGTTSIDQGQSATVTITADVAPGHDTQVNLTVNGSAQPDGDYVAFPPTVLFPSGQTSVQVTVQSKASTTIKPNRYLVVGLNQGSGYTIGALSNATITILGQSGDAAKPVATIAAGNLRVNGGNPAQFTISLDRATTQAISLALSFGGDAVQGLDFNPPGGVVTVQPGQTSLTVNVPTLNNGLVQPDRDLVVGLVPGDDYVVGTPASAGIVILTPTQPKLTLVGGGASTGLGGGAVFTVVADQAPVKDTSVQYTVTGTAQQGKDIQPVTGSVILAAGQTTATICIYTLNTNVFFLPTDMVTIAGPTALGKVFVKQGDAAPSGTPLFTLTEPNIAVSLQVSASDRTKLKVGQAATVQVQNSTVSAPGIVTKVDDFATTDKDTKKQYYAGTVQVQGTLNAADGTPVTVKVVTKEALGALTVPIAAVKQNGSGDDVVRLIDLNRGGRTREVKVKTGLTEGSYIQIESGLKASDVVVVELNQSGSGGSSTTSGGSGKG